MTRFPRKPPLAAAWHFVSSWAAPLAVVCLVTAISDLDGSWRLGIGLASGIGLIALALARGGSSGRLFVLLNLPLLALYLWAADARTAVSIAISQQATTLQVADTTLELPARSVHGAVGLQLSEQVARHGSQAPLLEPLPDLPRQLLLWPQANLRSGLRLHTAPGADQGLPATTVWQELQEAQEHWQVVAQTGDADVRLTFDLIRPSTMARIFLGDVPRDGLVVEIRPERRWLLIAEVRDGQMVQNLAGGELAYRPTLGEVTRSLVREVGRGWIWALILIAVAFTLSGGRSPQLQSRSLPVRVVVPLMMVAGLLATGYMSRFVLEGIPHVTDSVVYLFQARTFALGRLWAPTPPAPEFFEHQHLIVDGSRWFSKYPPGPALALLPGVLLGAPWINSPIFAALTLFLVYDLGKQLYHRGIALLGSLLLLLSPFFLFMSGSMMPHPFALFLTTLSMTSMLRSIKGSVPFTMCSGLSLGALALTRPLNALTLAILLSSWTIIALKRSHRTLARTAILLGLAGAVPLSVWMAYNWILVGNPIQNTMLIYWPFDRPGFGPDVGDRGGHDLPRGIANLWSSVLELQSHLYGWPTFLTLSLLLVALVGPARAWRDWWLGLMVMASVGAYVFYYHPGDIYGPRYIYECSGPLALLTARGLWVLARGGRPDDAAARFPVPAAVAAIIVFALLVGHNLALYLPREISTFRGYNGVNRARLDVVERAGLRNAVIFVSTGLDGWQAYSSVFAANSPLLDGPVLYAHDLGSDRNRQLLLDWFPGRRGYVLNGSRLRPL